MEKLIDWFEKDAIRYIEECENNGITFDENIRNSLIQSARAADSKFNGDNELLRINALKMLIEEAKLRGFDKQIILE